MQPLSLWTSGEALTVSEWVQAALPAPPQDCTRLRVAEITGSPEDFFTQGLAGSGSRLPFLPLWVINVPRPCPEGRSVSLGSPPSTGDVACSMLVLPRPWAGGHGGVGRSHGAGSSCFAFPSWVSAPLSVGPYVTLPSPTQVWGLLLAQPSCPESLGTLDLAAVGWGSRGPAAPPAQSCQTSSLPDTSHRSGGVSLWLKLGSQGSRFPLWVVGAAPEPTGFRGLRTRVGVQQGPHSQGAALILEVLAICLGGSDGAVDGSPSIAPVWVG